MDPIQSHNFHETDDTRSSAKMDEHKKLIEKFIERGYKLESQESKEEKGLDHELISKSFITILNAPGPDIPHIKLEAKEIFGKYNYQKETFEPFEHPRYVIKTYTRSASLTNYNDPWIAFDEE